MIINMNEARVKDAAEKRCGRSFAGSVSNSLTWSASISPCDFPGSTNWQRHCHRGSASLNPLDETLTQAEFVARDRFQMKVLAAEETSARSPMSCWSVSTPRPPGTENLLSTTKIRLGRG